MLEKFYDYLLSEGLEQITVEGYRRVLSKFIREASTLQHYQ